MRRHHALTSVMVLLTLFISATARSQDSNYWSSAYGTRAQLLGGVVTGSPGDISSVYYNPGALALAPSSEFLLAGNAVQFTRVSVKGGAGPRRDLVTSTITTLPSLIAGDIPILKTDRLAYSYLTRQQVDLDMEKNLTVGAESQSPLPNATFAAFELEYHQHVSESWYGGTWAHALSRRLGLGVSPELAVRSQQTTGSLFAMGENATGQQASFRFQRDFDYMYWRLLARVGLNGAHDSLTYGVTMTTPGLGLFGGGNYRQSVNLTDQTGAHGNILGATYQQDVPAHYHSPVGVGAGASYGWRAMRLHAAAEWWASVPRYALLDAAPYHVSVPITTGNPTGDSTVTTVVYEELKSVFNFGFGLEARLSQSVAGYASYHTDRTGRSPDLPPGSSVTAWDLNHVATGVTFDAWRSNFALGASAAFGSRPMSGFGQRADGVPSPEIKSSTLMLTGTLGWKISF
jgi:hypothetical protein